MKTQEELNILKGEVEAVSKKLHALSDEELAAVSGGRDVDYGLIRQLLEIIMAPLKEDAK